MILAVAEDTGGAEAAQEFYEAAKTTHPALIDTHHTVSALFNLVNVPSAVLIDEEGRIVRMDEGTYTRKYETGNLSYGTDEYLPMIRDWVKKGAESEHVRSTEEMAAELATWKRSQDESLADAHFRLGVYFKEAGADDKAAHHWQEAQRLHPESWNYHRQEWTFEGAAAAGRRWFEKVQTLEGKPYYRPIE